MPFRVFDLVTENRGGHLVRFVANDQVPTAVGGSELRLHIFITAELVEPRDDEIIFEKPIPCSRGFKLVVGQNVERQMKTPIKLVLPLLRKTPRANDEAPLQVPRMIVS
jgi:hypothetical protein